MYEHDMFNSASAQAHRDRLLTEAQTERLLKKVTAYQPRSEKRLPLGIRQILVSLGPWLKSRSQLLRAG